MVDIFSTMWKTVKVNNLTQMKVCDLDLCAIFLHFDCEGLLLWAALVNVFTFQASCCMLMLGDTINALALGGPFEASAAYANAPTFVGLDDAPGATATLPVGWILFLR